MYGSVQLVTLVIIQFIKGNTLMVLECLLETENGVNLDIDRQTNLVYFHRILLISSTYALGHCEMLIDSLHLT